jgi:hypothetical protein
MSFEQIGAALVTLGLFVSMIWGSPASTVSTGSWGIGQTDRRQNLKHRILTYVGPGISLAGCVCYILAAFGY